MEVLTGDNCTTHCKMSVEERAVGAWMRERAQRTGNNGELGLGRGMERAGQCQRNRTSMANDGQESGCPGGCPGLMGRFLLSTFSGNGHSEVDPMPPVICTRICMGNSGAS